MDDQLTVDAVSTVDPGDVRAWSQAPIGLPPGADPGSLRVHGAIRLEWSVDALVSYTRLDGVVEHVEVWRIGPWGLRASEPVRVAGDPVRVPSRTYVDPFDGKRREHDGARPGWFVMLVEYPLETREYHVEVDALRFKAETRLYGVTPRQYDLFISIRSADGQEAGQRVFDILREVNPDYDIWFMQRSERLNFEKAIVNVIRQARNYLVVYSDASEPQQADEAPVHGPGRLGPSVGALAARSSRPAPSTVNQSGEIDLILKELADTGSGAGKQLFIWDVRTRPQQGQVPEWAANLSWQLHDPAYLFHDDPHRAARATPDDTAPRMARTIHLELLRQQRGATA